MVSSRKNNGFTLIELVIVLAIAALILAGVLLAVSGAQKSRRDTQRKDIAGRLGAAMEAYASNNGGAYPAATLASSYTTNMNDPLTGGLPAYHAVGTDVTATNTVYYYSSAKCSSNKAVAGTSRNWAIEYWSENAGASVCIDNQ